jgi:large subunit ribosomal protein L18
MRIWRPYFLKVFFSNKYTYASILHKTKPSDGGHYVAAASTLQRSVRQALQEADQSLCDRQASVLVGRLLADKAKVAGVQEVHFDNHKGLRYQGKLKALIDSLRSHGLRVK